MEAAVDSIMTPEEKVEELGGSYRKSGGTIRAAVFGDDEDGAAWLREWLRVHGHEPGRVIADPDAGFVLFFREK